MHIKLGKLLEQTGKSILQIARETGLNRNTITTLMQDKEGGGLRLSTLEILHKTYGWKLADMVDDAFTLEPISTKSSPWYRQEGEVVPFTCWPWLIASCRPFGVPQVESHAQESRLYIKEDYGFVYWIEEAFSRWAKRLYHVYQEKDQHTYLYQEYLRTARHIEQLYLSLQQSPAAYKERSLKEIYEEISRYFQHFWNSSLFIDAFDVGVDQEYIKNISSKHDFTREETKILLTPDEPTFDRERRRDIIELAEAFAKQSIPLATWLDTSPLVDSHLRRWAFVRNNYKRIGTYTKKEMREELDQVLLNLDEASQEREEIEHQLETIASQIQKILKQHHLKENPLAFFQLLTYWREHRKKINLMGIHVLLSLLKEVEKKTGIPKEDLAYLAPEEFLNIHLGLVSKETLEQRRKQGVMIIMKEEGYRVLTGKEAESLKQECETAKESAQSPTILHGQIACQGYAQGTARIILSESDFTRFKDGNILVTSMTRPEFVPLMRRAAGIVTNEGGVTCHAAIVSRELNKPCLIGTRKATELIKEGDLIEVRAHHGTIRILQRTDR